MAGQFPQFGLIQIFGGDPTTGAGVPGLPYELLYRTDIAMLYIKSGTADTAWTQVGVSSSSISIGGGASLYGAGTDGNVTISIDTTLTRDQAYNDLTVNAGVVLNTGGFRIFVAGTLTLNGKISRNGNNGQPGSGTRLGGAALAAGTMLGSPVGGTGGTDSLAPGNGVGPSNAFHLTNVLQVNGGSAPAIGNPGPAGDNGGNGGGGGGGAGGATTTVVGRAGAIVPAGSQLPGNTGIFNAMPGMITGRNLANTAWGGFGSGAGGNGGGGGAGTGGAGGGGGSAAGWPVVVANNVVAGANAAIEAIGGNGGAGSTGSGGSGGGGGGGGAGGCVTIIIGKGDDIPFSVAGGSGGLGANGSGNGFAGGNGGNGGSGRSVYIRG